MRLRVVVVMRAMACTCSAVLGAARPLCCSARAWKRIFWLADAQPSVLMPATTPAGHSVWVLRRVCTSPLGSA